MAAVVVCAIHGVLDGHISACVATVALRGSTTTGMSANGSVSERVDGGTNAYPEPQNDGLFLLSVIFGLKGQECQYLGRYLWSGHVMC